MVLLFMVAPLLALPRPVAEPPPLPPPATGGALPADSLPTSVLPAGGIPTSALPAGAVPARDFPAGGLRPDGTPRLPKAVLPDKPAGGAPRSLLDGEGGAMHAWYCGQPGNEA